LRVTYFREDTRDALYTQSLPSPANPAVNVSRVQNVGRIATQGLETGLDRQRRRPARAERPGSLTYAAFRHPRERRLRRGAGRHLGKRQPNIPRWRPTALADYRWNERWSTSLGARYSSRQFRTLNNSDTNGYAYMGVSPLFVVDVRARLQIDKPPERRVRHRQPEQPHLLELPPLPAAQLRRGTESRPMNHLRLPLAALLAFASAAHAHVALEYQVAPAGSAYKATFKVGHGCGKRLRARSAW
jgi:hypothetical protein